MTRLIRFQTVVLAIATALTVNAHAEERNPAQSVLQLKSTADYSHLTEMPEEQTKSLADRCAEMQQEVEALKGKPQRRYLAMAKYRAECEKP